MRRCRLALALCLATALPLAAAPPPAPESTLSFGPFGTVHLYGDPLRAQQVVLFASGDGGWNLGVVDMARSLATLDSLIVGVDIRTYLKALGARPEKCSYPAADFEQLSQLVQKKSGRAHYTAPYLVGYSSGATLVYAVLVQAPSATFAGALSLGFCPDLMVSRRFCRGQGLEQDAGPKKQGVIFRPATTLAKPWIAFQGDIDQVCSPPDTKAYVEQVPNGHLVWLPHVGHGFSKPANWLPQLRQAFSDLVALQGERGQPAAGTEKPAGSTREALDVGGLPLIELPAQGTGDLLSVILSGDGGWAGLDKEVAGALNSQGIPVVGWDSLQYYWRARSADEAGADLARVLSHYLAAWKKERAVVIGYSFGADVAPFLVARLPQALRARVGLVALLGLSGSAQFEFHVAEWLGKEAKDSVPVAPEIARLEGLPVLCLFGADESRSICPRLPADQVKALQLSGGHHFGGDYAAVARQILAAVPAASAGR